MMFWVWVDQWDESEEYAVPIKADDAEHAALKAALRRRKSTWRAKHPSVRVKVRHEHSQTIDTIEVSSSICVRQQMRGNVYTMVETVELVARKLEPIGNGQASGMLMACAPKVAT